MNWGGRMDNINKFTKRIEFDDSNFPTLSVCMIVKNEENGLKRLLPELEKTVDEIIIVDTGSTDRTKKVAAKYGAKVYDFPWVNDFAAARNESLKHATKEYIMWLDGDDSIQRQEISKLKFHLMNNKGTAVFINLNDVKVNREFKSLQLRVFPNNPNIRFRGRVHEQVSFDIEALGIKYSNCPITVTHLGYDSPKTVEKKLERNLEILKEEYKEPGKSEEYLINLHIGKTCLGLNKIDEARPYVEKAYTLVKENKHNVSSDNAFLAVMSKVTILVIDNKSNEAIKVLEDLRELFSSNKTYKLTLGEMYFRNKFYQKAYKELLILKNRRLEVTLVPIEPTEMLKTLTMFLLVSSLSVGDFRTAEGCVGKMFNDSQFKIPRK